MVAKIKRISILAALGGFIMLALMLVSVSYVDVGVTDDFWSDGFNLSGSELSDVPQSVVDDAANLANRLFGSNQRRYEEFVFDLLETYESAKNKDFVVIFNPGGWGRNSPEETSGWETILAGIEAELKQEEYSSLVVNYRRTGESVWSTIKELVEMGSRYPSKARDLASRVGFLTEHLPELRVILTGESNGTVFTDRAMYILEDNERVYSIQTGTPFWYDPAGNERSLVLNNNGMVPDTFARGDFPSIVWASLKSVLGIETPVEEEGTILLHLKAPGHDYSWAYPEISESIKGFLENNFGLKRS